MNATLNRVSPSKIVMLEPTVAPCLSEERVDALVVNPDDLKRHEVLHVQSCPVCTERVLIAVGK